MRLFRERVLAGDFLAGGWCNLASPIATEIAAAVGYDWLLIDQEHAPGDNWTLLHQVQAASRFPTTLIVRLPWNDRVQAKRALDLGVGGVMIPYVQDADEARAAVRYAKFPPQGERGAAASPRCGHYGLQLRDYLDHANERLVTVAQIETGRAVEQAGDIAAVDGVDVLFVGPLDLSLNLNRPEMFDDADYVAALSRVSRAARAAGKAAGILLSDAARIPLVKELGFTFVACGTDGGAVMAGLKRAVVALRA